MRAKKENLQPWAQGPAYVRLSLSLRQRGPCRLVPGPHQGTPQPTAQKTPDRVGLQQEMSHHRRICKYLPIREERSRERRAKGDTAVTRIRSTGRESVLSALSVPRPCPGGVTRKKMSMPRAEGQQGHTGAQGCLPGCCARKHRHRARARQAGCGAGAHKGNAVWTGCDSGTGSVHHFPADTGGTAKSSLGRDPRVRVYQWRSGINPHPPGEGVCTAWSGFGLVLSQLCMCRW